MDRINGAGHVGHLFVAEDASISRPPTEITAEWLNGVQEEIVAVIEAAGITPNSGDLDQLLEALRSPGVFQTQPQFDSDSSAATTAFVQRALGNAQGVVLCNTGVTNLTAGDVGKAVILAQSGAVVVLPPLASVPNGSVFTFGNGTSNGAGAVNRSGADQMFIADKPFSSISVAGGETLTLCKYGGGWFGISGSVTLLASSSSFLSSLTGNGYQRLPSGLIIQWGTSGAVAAGAQVNVTLPITFPNAIFSVTGTPVGASVNSNAGGVGIAASLGALTIYNWGSSIAYSAGVRWIAIGY